MGVLLINQTLGAAFAPSAPLQISGEAVVLDFTITVPAGPGVNVEWYPEYTSENPATGNYFREVSEEDVGKGDVRMSGVIRRFTQFNSDAALAAGTYRFNVQLRRQHAFVRLQLRGASAVVQVFAPYGEAPLG